MYYYFSRPKMSASAAGAAGVGAGGAGRLQNGSRCARGRGCGEPMNGDGGYSAVATATTTTSTECCDQESRVAEAQPNSDWDKAAAPCITAEPGTGKQKKNNTTASFFVNGNTDSIIIRERPGACGQYGDSGGLGCDAVGRQCDRPGENNGINIDHEPEGLRHGGERRCFMDSASSKGERRASKPQAPVTGRRNFKGQSQTEGAVSMTAAARCGHQNAQSANSKRRGCSYTLDSKRVCYAGTASVADCGSLDTGSGIHQDSGGTLLNLTESHSSVSDNDNGSQSLGSNQGDEGVCEQHQVRRSSAAGSHKSNSTVCPHVAGDASNVNSIDMAPCRTSKGRVRLYRVRSFLASTSGYHNGHGENGRCDLNGSSKALPPQGTVLPNKHSRPAAGISEQRGNGGSHDGASSTQEAVLLCVSEADSSGAEAEDTPVKLDTQVEQASGEASRRQAELEERSERVLRRLQAVQVKQVERHVSQQLQGLRRASRGSGDRKPAVLSHSSRRELSRMAHNCSEVLCAAGGALDSDHTASSSGGSSDSEEEEEEEEEEEVVEGAVRRRGTLLRSAKAVRRAKEMQWAQERAWLGSRWVWLQAQVSELEYRIRALTELYTQLRQGKVRTVPDTPIRVPRPPPSQNSATCRSSSAGETLRKTKAEDTTPPPFPPPTASAARVCLLPRLRRHKLLRLEAFPALGSKAVSLPCPCGPSVVCVLCGGGPPRPPHDIRECVKLRRSRLDLCVHPVLTLPSDIPLVVQCGTSPLVGVSQNALRRTGLSAPPPGLSRRGQGTQRMGRVRRRLVCPRPPTTLPPLQHSTGGISGRNYRGVFSPGLLTQRITNLPPLSVLPHAPGTASQPLRRRRGESSFDIDNLVMPMGLTGLGARVQKLQYKEIITPSWREIGDESEVSPPALPDYTHSQQLKELPGEPEPEEFEEDPTDGVFLSRHAVCEGRERGRWRNSAHRRRRGRSSSFHGEGRWGSRLLDVSPASPDPRQGYPAEGESSPVSPPPSTDPEDASFLQPEEEQQVRLPWERRTFPLLEAELAALQEEEEEEDPCEGSGRSQSTDSGISLGSLELSPRTPQPAASLPTTLITATSSTQDSPCPPRSLLSAAIPPRPPPSPPTLLPQ